MHPPEFLRELSVLAGRLEVDLRFESFDGLRQIGPLSRGGLCRLYGRPTIVVDEGLSVLDKIEVVAQALSTLDLDRVYMPPQVRTELERRRAT
jgi:hypothetical protein